MNFFHDYILISAKIIYATGMGRLCLWANGFSHILIAKILGRIFLCWKSAFNLGNE